MLAQALAYAAEKCKLRKELGPVRINCSGNFLEEGGKKAACALCVGVGSLCDPPQLDGLAHFTEHMVFMGTERYPDENEWAAFLAKRGGEDNGETDAETTLFYFDVHPSYLRAALERFGQFFAAPLFNFNSAQREEIGRAHV